MIQVNVNPYSQPNELQYALDKVKVSALVMPTSHKHYNYMRSLIEVAPQVAAGKAGNGSLRSRDLPDLRHVIVFGEEEPVKGAWDFDEILNGAGTLDLRVLDNAETKVKPDDPVNIQYTSGTTGYPKACTLTHFNLLNNSYMAGTRANWHKEHHIICLNTPLYHTFGCVTGVLNALNHLQTCVFPSVSYEVPPIFEAIQEERCTFLFGTPTMYTDLVSSPLMKNYDVGSVRGGYIGGAPCPTALCERMINELNMKDLYIAYGSTELSPAVVMSSSDQPVLKRIENVGHVMPHCETVYNLRRIIHFQLVIIDEMGHAVPRGERGELCARGYMTMLGYWEDDESTRKDLTRDRWYHTGDTASMNEDGSVMIVGRIKDMICRGGENIYPTEIEHYIDHLPYVADAHVIGVPDDRLGEVVCAWIRLREEHKGKITPEDIIADCKGKVSFDKHQRLFQWSMRNFAFK
ncbi:AMP-binding domain protein [Oesophagostomum dentatum]|uniref:AMP-binding domain protein n=1 Tax=Oesophagostomum dentatum TaxID=61180 RepID=A0A0B1TPU3_OESDE|nr:AMP-binding domain protein [Oesophagostomum dentatum]